MDDHHRDPGIHLMLAYQAGDDGAFDHLVEAYSGRIYALFTRFLGAVPGREDLVQDVFVRVIGARERYRPTARFSTWLYRIVFNLCVNERERRARRAEVSLEGTASNGEAEGVAASLADPRTAPPSAGLENADVVRAVRSAIASLPAAQRMALILSKYEELSYAEVAQVLGSTEKAIKSLVHRARENLRARLASFLQGDLA